MDALSLLEKNAAKIMALEAKADTFMVDLKAEAAKLRQESEAIHNELNRSYGFTAHEISIPQGY